MLRRSTHLLSSRAGHQYIPHTYFNTTSKTSSCLNNHDDHNNLLLPSRPPISQQQRAYAVVSGGHSRDTHDTLPWPEVTATHRIPTPYQIFALRKGQPYSKKRFYELVKLYHPDRQDQASGLPYHVKIERYRLVVAANTVLSCPIKRGAYDAYGAGWNGQPEVMSPSRYDDGAMRWGDFNARGWQGGANGPSNNANWEDWEKWYAKQDPNVKQEPLYVNNAAFVSLIVMFAALGGIGQATRMGNYSATYIEQVDAVHCDMSQDLVRRRQESRSSGDREERIQTFLKTRESANMTLIDDD